MTESSASLVDVVGVDLYVELYVELYAGLYAAIFEIAKTLSNFMSHFSSTTLVCKTALGDEKFDISC